MENVVVFPRAHARALTKSSAVISPPDQIFNFESVSQSGRCTPRLIRLIVGRETPIAEATSSSSSSRAAMKSDKCAMPRMYVKRTSAVKRKCTPDVLYDKMAPVHDTHMASTAKKVTPRLKGPQFRTTFIRQWRLHRELTQEQLAERVATYLAERGIAKGYTHASIGRLENGKMGYTQPVLEAIADALRTDPASLLMRDPTDTQALWSVWDQAQPAERKLITEQAELVVRNRRRSA